MSYFSLFYHYTWHTIHNSPVLRGNYEKKVHQIIRSIIDKNSGIFLVTIGGTDDHIHLLISTKSTMAPAKVAQVIKGTSSETINQNCIFPFHFLWQHEYGCVTVDKRSLEQVKAYCIHQREHHLKKTMIHQFECIDFRETHQENAWG